MDKRLRYSRTHFRYAALNEADLELPIDRYSHGSLLAYFESHLLSLKPMGGVRGKLQWPCIEIGTGYCNCIQYTLVLICRSLSRS